MRRLLYLFAEFVTFYLIMVLFAVAIIGLTLGFGGFGGVLMILLLVMLIPVSFKAVLVGIGVNWTGLSRPAYWLLTGTYRPVRPLAVILPLLWNLKEGRPVGLWGNRKPLVFTYEPQSAPDSLDVADALAAELTRQNISHTRSTGLHVRDGATQWMLMPVLNQPKLEGWVQADDARDREAAEQAIRTFLTAKLNLVLTQGSEARHGV